MKKKKKKKNAVLSGYRKKITVVTNYRALPWWLATVQSIPWLSITVHHLLCNTVVAAFRGKRYRDEKSLPRKALDILGYAKQKIAIEE